MVQRATPGCVGGKHLKYPSPGDKQNLPPSADWAGSAHSCGAQRQQLWLALGGGGIFGTEKAAGHKSCRTFSTLHHGHQLSGVGHAART